MATSSIDTGLIITLSGAVGAAMAADNTTVYSRIFTPTIFAPRMSGVNYEGTPLLVVERTYGDSFAGAIVDRYCKMALEARIVTEEDATQWHEVVATTTSATVLNRSATTATPPQWVQNVSNFFLPLNAQYRFALSGVADSTEGNRWLATDSAKFAITL